MSTILRFAVLVSVFLFLPACTVPRPQTAVTQKFDESAIREAVWAHMIDHWRARNWPVTLFVSIGNDGKDDLIFVAKHSNVDAKIFPASKYSHGAGVMCHIGKVTQISPTEVLVEGSYTYSLEGGEAGTFNVRFVNGRWTVTQWEVAIVS